MVELKTRLLLGASIPCTAEELFDCIISGSFPVGVPNDVALTKASIGKAPVRKRLRLNTKTTPVIPSPPTTPSPATTTPASTPASHEPPATDETAEGNLANSGEVTAPPGDVPGCELPPEDMHVDEEGEPCFAGCELPPEDMPVDEEGELSASRVNPVGVAEGEGILRLVDLVSDSEGEEGPRDPIAPTRVTRMDGEAAVSATPQTVGGEGFLSYRGCISVLKKLMQSCKIQDSPCHVAKRQIGSSSWRSCTC